ncbi:MAG: hypothetical protein ABI557_08230, partial [Aureliella sp.]
MNRCSECNFPLEDGLPACPQCGTVILLQGDNDGTINVSADPGSQTVDFEVPIPLEHHGDNAPEYNRELSDERGDEQAGSGTVIAPGVDGNLQDQTVDIVASDQWDDPDEINQTVDAGLTELDEADDFDFDDDFPGVFSDGLDEHGTVDANGSTLPSELADLLGDNQGTINAFGIPDNPKHDGESSDPNATHVSEDDEAKEYLGNITIDMSAEERPTHQGDVGRLTVDASRSSPAFPVVPPASGTASNDAARTVALPGSLSVSAGDKTIVFESMDSGNSTVQATGVSGTEGRLKRLWEGVAGSSENPMHSLQAIGLQASDSIFQRVATRRVADAGVSEDVTADYQIVDKLGEGAMGIVFSARQTAVNRIVAIKTAKPNFQSNDESRRRF